MCNATHISIDIDNNESDVRNTKDNDIGNFPSAIDLDENNDSQIFKTADLSLKFIKVDNKKLADDVRDVLSFTALTAIGYQAYLQNIESCKKAVESRLKERCVRFKMNPRSIPSVWQMSGIGIHTFHLRDAKELFRKQFFFVTDLEVVLWPCVEGSSLDHSLHNVFCYDVYESEEKRVQRSAKGSESCEHYIDAYNFFLVGMA